MSADTLSHNSRHFFERSRLKLTLSLVLGAASLFLLGQASSFGGLAHDYNLDAKEDDVTHYEKQGALAQAGGYGVGCFVLLVGFLILFAAALYASPFVGGSPNEKKMINSPQELDFAGESEPAQYSYEKKSLSASTEPSNAV